MMAIDYVQVGQRLRAHRVGSGMSPEQVAERLEISWNRAAKGVSGAALLRKCLKEPQI
jgi:hypothetical protein